jgi:DNA-binding NtrC family response regulator
MRDTLEAILQREHDVFKASDGQTALRLVAEHEINVILLDMILPDMSGLDVLKQVKDRFSDIEVIMITVVKEVETAVQAMKLGAFHYMTKTFEYDEVLALVEKAIERRRDAREILYLRTEMKQFMEGEFIIGRSPKMREIHEMVNKVAHLPATVLILGESGTGKQLLARYIHGHSGLSEQPFVMVDLGAVPETLVESTLFGHEKGAFSGAYRQHIGKFELADGGTLFLDEMANLRYELQSKLLRAIQDGQIERVGGTKTIQVNVRLIAASNVDLAQAVRKGSFREDLYYRLNVIPIKLPSLRERVGDIPQLVEFFIQRYNKRFRKNIEKISQRALEALSSYDWPGNVRELENMIERLVAVLDGDTILLEDIPIEYRMGSFQKPQEGLLEKAAEAFEQSFILRALERQGWSQIATAKVLGIPVSTLKYKLKKLSLSKHFPPRRK